MHDVYWFHVLVESRNLEIITLAIWTILIYRSEWMWENQDIKKSLIDFNLWIECDFDELNVQTKTNEKSHKIVFSNAKVDANQFGTIRFCCHTWLYIAEFGLSVVVVKICLLTIDWSSLFQGYLLLKKDFSNVRNLKSYLIWSKFGVSHFEESETKLSSVLK